jgi:hypothetical protein
MSDVRCRMHGLDIRSSIPLFQRRLALSDHDDVVLDWGHNRSDTSFVPVGRVIAEAVTDGKRFYVLVETDDGYRLRFHGICDFDIDRTLRRVTCHLSDGADADLVPVLGGGGLFASLLMLRGELVLHASAAVVGQVAIAFVGESGMGKSTLATLMSSAGAPLLTDDVLRVQVDGNAYAYAGSTETRLRDGSLSMVDVSATIRRAGDGRTAVSPDIAVEDVVPLGAIVVPFPSRTVADVQATRLSAHDALLLMIRFPRILGWRDQVTIRTYFANLADLASEVPVYAAEVPWGMPFPDRVVADLAALCGEQSCLPTVGLRATS